MFASDATASWVRSIASRRALIAWPIDSRTIVRDRNSAALKRSLDVGTLPSMTGAVVGTRTVVVIGDHEGGGHDSMIGH